MKRKIPEDAFDFYYSLGLERSYQRVADEYKVSKQAVTNMATKEDWQGRLKTIELKARLKSEKKAVETAQAIRNRHLQAARVIQTKALEALKKLSLDSAMDAVKALDLGVKQERLLIGEASERSEVRVEDIIKREYKNWMIRPSNGSTGSAQSEEAHAE